LIVGVGVLLFRPMPRIFEPFHATKPVGKGSGLGLRMVYGFALRSDGFVDVSSAPGKGATVNRYLLRFLKDAAQGTVQTAMSPATSTVL
jgi:signal transduction histidine kinase